MSLPLHTVFGGKEKVQKFRIELREVTRITWRIKNRTCLVSLISLSNQPSSDRFLLARKLLLGGTGHMKNSSHSFCPGSVEPCADYFSYDLGTAGNCTWARPWAVNDCGLLIAATSSSSLNQSLTHLLVPTLLHPTLFISFIFIYSTLHYLAFLCIISCLLQTTSLWTTILVQEIHRIECPLIISYRSTITKQPAFPLPKPLLLQRLFRMITTVRIQLRTS